MAELLGTGQTVEHVLGQPLSNLWLYRVRVGFAN
jgi:hypothetical protein